VVVSRTARGGGSAERGPRRSRGETGSRESKVSDAAADVEQASVILCCENGKVAPRLEYLRSVAAKVRSAPSKAARSHEKVLLPDAVVANRSQEAPRGGLYVGRDSGEVRIRQPDLCVSFAEVPALKMKRALRHAVLETGSNNVSSPSANSDIEALMAPVATRKPRRALFNQGARIGMRIFCRRKPDNHNDYQASAERISIIA